MSKRDISATLRLIERRRFQGRALFIFAAALLAFVANRSVYAGTFDLTTASVADINAAMDAGKLNSEQLVKLYLARIKAYDHDGPKINAVLAVNPKAIEIARALDAERYVLAAWRL